MRGETKYLLEEFSQEDNFNPLSPCGERLLLHVANHTKGDFNPLSPCGERL